METRKINESEIKRTIELFHIAFEFPASIDKTNDELLAEINNNPRSRGDKYCVEKWASFDEENNMMGWIGTLPLNVNFDGNIVKMTGIGGVSTLPQYRKNGVIRACFDASLKSMYDEDYIFSYLYPFSTAYYRKFGYELCGEVNHYYINLRSIKNFPEADGKMYLVEHGSHLEDIKKVYSEFVDGYNMSCVRDDIDYSIVTESNPANDMKYIYVYKDKNGVAKGVMSFTKEKVDGKFNMQTDYFFFSDLEGLKGLLNHTQAFVSYYEHIVFKLPLDINITSLIPEWALYSYKRESYFNGMVRVVNAQKALLIAKYQGSGSLVINIKDKQIAQNNNTFEVRFENGKAVSVDATEKQYDISMDIADFSRLLVGTHNPFELKYVEAIDVKADLNDIGKVFYKKPNFVYDRF